MDKRKKVFWIKWCSIGLIVLVAIAAIFYIVQTLTSDKKETAQEETVFKQEQGEKDEMTQVNQPTEPIKVTENGIEYEYEYTDGYTAMVATNEKKVVAENVIPNLYTSINGIMIDKKGNTSLGYDLIAFYIPSIFEDEHLTRIEYLLENCAGTVNGSLSYRVGMDYEVKSEPYVITSYQSQKNVYICTYVKWKDSSASISEKAKIVHGTLQNARLKVKLSYDDQREEIHYIGFRPYNEYNYNQFRLSNLTLE